MLNALRKIASTWFGKILGALLIVGLAGFGISNVILDLGTNTLAKVGDEEITVREFQRAYNTQLNAVAQQLGSIPTAQQALSLGIPSAVINRLASDAAVNRVALNLGLGVSEARLAKMLREDPSFGDMLGSFDRSNFLRVLQQNGYTEAEYFDLQTKAARRQQIALGLFAGTTVPVAAQTLVSRYAGDTRTLEYFTLNGQSIPPVADPTDDELKAYLTAHQAEYRTKEARTVDLLALSPDVLAAGKTFTDDEIAAEYEKTKANLVKIEKRTIEQVALPSEGTAKWFQLQKDAGVKFADAVKTAGLKITELGTLSKAEINDAALAEAAFGLNEGDFAIIPGIGGQRAVGVTRIEPGGQISLEDAKADIAKRMAFEAGRAEFADMLDQVETLRAAFKPLKDIADRFKLPLAHVTLTADGAELAAVASITEANRATVAKAIFAADQEKLPPTISLGGNSNVWFDLQGVEVARDQTLDEVHDAVATAWNNEKTDEALKEEIKKIMAELDGGTSFADVAAERSQFASVSQPITRGGDKTPVLNQTVAAAAFAGGPDSHGSALDADGDYVVFHITEITPASDEGIAQAKTFLEEKVRDFALCRFHRRTARRGGHQTQPAGAEPGAAARSQRAVMRWPTQALSGSRRPTTPAAPRSSSGVSSPTSKPRSAPI